MMGLVEQLNKLRKQGLLAVLSAAGGLIFLLSVFYVLLGPLGAVLAALSDVQLPYLLIMAGALICLFFGCLAYHKNNCESQSCAAEEKATAAETRQKEAEEAMNRQTTEATAKEEELSKKKEKIKKKKNKLEDKEKRLEECEAELKKKNNELTNKERGLETREDEIIRMQNGAGGSPIAAPTSTTGNPTTNPGDRSNRN